MLPLNETMPLVASTVAPAATRHPEPIVLPDAGHFVPEHGETIARRAVGYFRP